MIEQKISSYQKDRAFSERMTPFWDAYYASDAFKEKLQELRLRGKVEIVRIDRSNNPLFQAETYLDIVLSLSTGSCLKVDEKCLRFPRKPEWLNTFPIEVVSNPKGKRDGWGYHVGTTIAMAHANPLENGFYDEPLLFTISQEFIDEVVRGNDFTPVPSCSTNGLYRSICKYVPRRILERYWP